MLCCIAINAVRPIIAMAIAVLWTPTVIAVSKRPIGFLCCFARFYTLFTSVIGGISDCHISMCCGNRFFHAVKTSGYFKHTLCRRICLVIPNSVVRRSSCLAIVVYSLIPVDINGNDHLLDWICRLLSLITFRFLIIIGIIG